MPYPQLIREENKVTLLSDGKPFLILGGEAHNSSSTSLEYMDKVVWPQVRSLHLNTLLVAVTWELLEPEEGKFDFTLPDGLIAQAEREHTKLIFLWFGLWKNGMSTYVPQWIKADKSTYFPMRDRDGKPIDAISPLCKAGVDKDSAAFSALMAHLRDHDTNRTVLMVQVENEMGLLGDVRDFSPAANAAYRAAVPSDMAQFACIEGGTWAEAFGQDAPELFMTYHYAKATETIAKAGKLEYDIPLFVNAWLEQYPFTPGTYPCGAPIAKTLPVWQRFAPHIDLLSPDIYLPQFEQVCAEYTQCGNPLFIPEAMPTMNAASNVFSALGKFHALGFSPFAIEDLGLTWEKPAPGSIGELDFGAQSYNRYRAGEYLSESYALLHTLLPLLQAHRGVPRLQGFVRDGAQSGALLHFQSYDLRIQYLENGTESPNAAGLVIELDDNTFLLAGHNFRAIPLPRAHDERHAAFLSIEEGRVESARFHPARRLNGDEHHLIFPSHPTLRKATLRLF